MQKGEEVSSMLNRKLFAAILALPLHTWADLQWQPASASGGEAFAMQGGVVASAAYLANKIAKCRPAPPQPPTFGLIPPANVSPAPTLGWVATSCGPGDQGGPPDPQVAASSSTIVVGFNTSIAWYNKSGVQQGELSNFDLFEPLLATLGQSAGRGKGYCNLPPTLNGTCAQTQSDLRVIYDEFRKRFWALDGAGVFSADRDPNKARGIMMLAVSQTEDPKDGWYLYWWDAVAHFGIANDATWQPQDGGDYPCIGIDSFGFYQTISAYHLNGGGYQHVVIFPAWDDKVINGTAVAGWHYYDLQLAGGIIQPVMHHGVGGNTYFVSRYDTDKVVVWSMTNPTLKGNMLRAVVKLNEAFDDQCFVPLPEIAACDASQLNSPSKIAMSNLYSSILKAVYRDGELAFVAADARDWFGDMNSLSSIRLVRLWLLGGPPFIVQLDNFDNTFGKNDWDDNPSDRMSYGWPAVEMNKDHNLAVVYAKSGATIYPQVRYSAHLAHEFITRPSQLLKLGEATFKPDGCGSDINGNPYACRWGDLAGAAVDPDDTGIWLAHQFANASHGYDIWVARVF
jgi:hypothetical protein